MLYLKEGGGILKRAVYKMMCLLCTLVILISIPVLPVNADTPVWANDFAYTLNSAMLNCGVLSTAECGDYLGLDTASGVIYADLVEFDESSQPSLIIVRYDNENSCVSVDIYEHEKNSAEIVVTISKGFDIPDGNIGEIALGDDGERRYIAYNEYSDGEKVLEEYYTVINGDAFVRVNTPQSANLSGVLSFGFNYLHPEVDVSFYNKYLSTFFSTLKDMSADNVEYQNILDNITTAEKERISRVLGKTTGFTSFDIGDYSSMSEYSMAVKKHDGEGAFNAITHVYDLGNEIYYVRYSTDRCFYNGTILRRTDMVTDNYQILAVRNDFIPFSDTELNSLKEAYEKNRLLLEKSSGSIELKTEPLIKVNKLDIEKKIDTPQMISPDLRKPIAFIGGGVCLILLVILWIYITSDEK